MRLHHRQLVVIPVYGQFELAAACLQAIHAYTAPDVDVLVIDDASPAPFLDSLPDAVARDPRFHFRRNAENRGFVRTVNDAMDWRPDTDLAIVNSDVIVSSGWLERLTRCAYESEDVATVSVMADNGSILSVQLDGRTPGVNEPTDLELLNLRLASLPAIPAPEIPVAIGHCFLIRRAAIDLVGSFDEKFSPGYGEEVDFSLRCRAAGMRHVVAPDVFVLHRSGASFGQLKPALIQRGSRLILGRHPDYEHFIAEFMSASDQLRALFLRVLIAARGRLTVVAYSGVHTPASWGSVLGGLAADPSIDLTAVYSGKEAAGAGNALSMADAVARVEATGRYDCVVAPLTDGDASRLREFWRIGHRVLLLDIDPDDAATSAPWRNHKPVANFVADAIIEVADQGLSAASVVASVATRICAAEPRVPHEVRELILSGAPRMTTLRRLRQSRLGLYLLPPNSARHRLLRRVLGLPTV